MPAEAGITMAAAMANQNKRQRILFLLNVVFKY
jgi:hypothetical protein